MKLHLPKSLRSAMLAVIVSACSFTLSSASLCAAESPAAEPAASGEPAASAAPVQANGSAFVATILDVLDAVIGGSSSVGSASVGMGGTSFTMAAPVQDNGTEAPAPVSSPAPDNLAPLTVPVETSSPAPVDYTVKCDYQGENLSAAPAASVSSLDLAPKAAPYVSGGASSSGSSSSPASAPAAGGGAAGGASGSAGRPAPLMLAAAAPSPVVKKAGESGRSLAWLGGKRFWSPTDGTFSWRLQEGVQQVAFVDGDNVLFEPTSEETVAIVNGNFSVNNMVLGSVSQGERYTVTIDTLAENSLSVNRITGYADTALVKEGEGSLSMDIYDGGFRTDVTALGGETTLGFYMGDTTASYVYANMIAEDGAILNFKIGSDNYRSNVGFDSNVTIKNVSSIDISKGSVFSSNAYYDTVNSGFFMDRDIVVHLGGANQEGQMATFIAHDVSLKADHWTIEGRGFATFGGTVYWFNDSDEQLHLIGGESYVDMYTVRYCSPNSVVRIENSSSLEIGKLYMNDGKNGANHLYHAFQEDGMNGERQNVYIYDTLYIGGGEPAHIGAAAGVQDYQEAGDFDIERIEGAGTLVLENNVEATSSGQCLTEVFYIGNEGGIDASHYSWFKGQIRLEGKNSGLADNHKKTALVIHDYMVTYDAVLEVSNQGQYSDYFIGVDDDISVNGIRDVGDASIGSTNTVKIFSGSVDRDKNAVFESDEKVRELLLYTQGNATNEYRSSAGVDRNLNLAKVEGATQTFTGDFSKFDAGIRVGRIKEKPELDDAGGILNILNNATVNVKDLTICRDSRLNVNRELDYSDNGTVVVSGIFNARGTETKDKNGHASQLDANLTMSADSILDVHAAGGFGGVDMGHYTKENELVSIAESLGGTLTFEVGSGLSSKDMDIIWGLKVGDMYDLAFNVSGLTVTGLGSNQVFNWNDVLEPNVIDAKDVFTGNGFIEGEFYLCYTGAGHNGGGGNNVGTVYLYRASVPEPTTGTLSLLALAGLAARRRRK